ncbi:MAG: sigma-70 family RNA polymerase sigma factor [Verrucomicrobiales bacterium]|jgi:RNA polymerase sigma-70 factor, ECF subfamily|nr:sigma-70 family RNA polymerase sigma factor [Verrucomicrobiales bacterium]MDP4792557.1 sigma-70 family RNA polymerase sigma factor [Verrucomicrobiales bacterium]MDP5005352.1 sigma-70 family RNA polymerase sigma factor [Verrucomicrobiales bacterium]
MPESEHQNESRGETFSRLLMAERRRILGFIQVLVQDRSAAEDVLQDVSAVLWTKFDQFELGTDFAAWAMCVARLTVLNWRRKQSRLPVALSDETLQLLADEAVAALSVPDEERREVLQACLRRLPEEQRELLRAHYEHGEEVSSIAQTAQRSTRSIYLRLEKIHAALLDCMQHKNRLNAGGTL